MLLIYLEYILKKKKSMEVCLLFAETGFSGQHLIVK
jgi:hypothetical protein